MYISRSIPGIHLLASCFSGIHHIQFRQSVKHYSHRKKGELIYVTVTLKPNHNYYSTDPGYSY